MQQTDWQADRGDIETLVNETGDGHFLIGDPAGTTMLMDARFPAFEGSLDNGPYLRIGLLKGPPARLYQKTDLGLIDTTWKPGALAVTLPRMTGEFASSTASMVGLAIDLDRIAHCEECGWCVEDLIEAASSLHEDPLITSVMTALRHYAEVHGCSSAFFDHGVAIVLDRLASMRGAAVEIPRSAPLSASRLGRVTDLIELRLSEDVSVRDMAVEAGQERSGFTRAFKAATGMTPFAYLTLRRMERAKLLLGKGLSVTHVALAVGYANPSKFAEAFRRVVGLSPSAWRKTATPVSFL